MLSYPRTEGNKSGPETLIYWACDGSWWPQFLLDRLLMSGSTVAMQVFIFCYKNYAKSTGADAIKDRTALEGSHQMLSCSVTHAASVPNSSFSNIRDFKWILSWFFHSHNKVKSPCNLTVSGLCEFCLCFSILQAAETVKTIIIPHVQKLPFCSLQPDTTSIKTRCGAQDARQLLRLTWSLLQHYCFKHHIRWLEIPRSSNNSPIYAAVQLWSV